MLKGHIFLKTQELGFKQHLYGAKPKVNLVCVFGCIHLYCQPLKAFILENKYCIILEYS